MTTDHITATHAADITKSLLNANIDHPDAWIPIQRSDLDIIAAVIARALQLEANIANMLTLLNGSVAAAPNAPAPPEPWKCTLPPMPKPRAELTATDIARNVGAIDWLQIAYDHEDLDAAHTTYVRHLAEGNLTWRKLEEQTRHNLVYWIIYRIQVALDDETITASLYDRMAPAWAAKASALYKTKPFTEWVSDAKEKYASLAEPFRG